MKSVSSLLKTIVCLLAEAVSCCHFYHLIPLTAQISFTMDEVIIILSEDEDPCCDAAFNDSSVLFVEEKENGEGFSPEVWTCVVVSNHGLHLYVFYCVPF